VNTSFEPKSCKGCVVADTCVLHTLSLADSQNLAPAKTTFAHPAGEIIVQQGSTVNELLVLRVGWAAKFMLFPDGRRQIIDILLPGDLCSCEELVKAQTQSSIVALSNVQVCTFERDPFVAQAEILPGYLQVLGGACMSQFQRLRELLAALGQQSAEARIAAFVLSIHRRLTALKHTSSSEMPFYLRQQDLADVLGLTQVHISRMLKLLKDKNIIEVVGEKVKILDLPALVRISQT